MSRGLGWVERLLFDFLRRRKGAASFDAILLHAFLYNMGEHRTQVETVRRALKSLQRKGYVEKDEYKGVVIYSVKAKPRSG